MGGRVPARGVYGRLRGSQNPCVRSPPGPSQNQTPLHVKIIGIIGQTPPWPLVLITDHRWVGARIPDEPKTRGGRHPRTRHVRPVGGRTGRPRGVCPQATERLSTAGRDPPCTSEDRLSGGAPGVTSARDGRRMGGNAVRSSGRTRADSAANARGPNAASVPPAATADGHGRVERCRRAGIETTSTAAISPLRPPV